eukprot:6185901-Pleurochrysis_carterae.AAC.1
MSPPYQYAQRNTQKKLTMLFEAIPNGSASQSAIDCKKIRYSRFADVRNSSLSKLQPVSARTV